MDTWPEYAVHAFHMVYYGDSMKKPSKRLYNVGGTRYTDLSSSPGGWNARREGIALFALGYSGQEREQLLSSLQSAEPMERWASALVLGEIKEERALPVLVRYLTSFCRLK